MLRMPKGNASSKNIVPFSRGVKAFHLFHLFYSAFILKQIYGQVIPSFNINLLEKKTRQVLLCFLMHGMYMQPEKTNLYQQKIDISPLLSSNIASPIWCEKF